MTLVGIVVVLVVVGLILWLINTYIPMAAAIKSLLNIVVFVVVLIWLLQIFGVLGPINGFHIPNLK
ncbi:MAG TPA: Thivi_2564 family membrane protein [Candidatus Binataceae bacterium]|nr:Thivi_2564 family membrane protein [Candidatus Binataceae bacterium]